MIYDSLVSFAPASIVSLMMKPPAATAVTWTILNEYKKTPLWSRIGLAGLAGKGIVVHAANIHDTKSGISTAKRAYKRYPSVQKFCADAGYRGTFVSDLKEQFNLDVDLSERIKPHQWEKLPWRWIVERTLSWLNHSRRLSKNYGISISSAKAMVKISHLHTLLKRL